MRKFGLSGAHGTGKSTLLKYIKNSSFGDFSITPEAPRAIVDQVGDESFFHRNNNSLSKQLCIFSKHLQQEISGIYSEIMITDRTLVDHLAYSECLFSMDANYQEVISTLKNISSEHLKTFEKIFYLPIEFPVIDDGVRESDNDFQKEIDFIIRRLYLEFDIEVVMLTGSVDERFQKLLHHLGELNDSAKTI